MINFERARHLPTKSSLDRLLAHPAMEKLVDLAKSEGIAVELRPDPPGDIEVVAVLVRRRRD